MKKFALTQVRCGWYRAIEFRAKAGAVGELTTEFKVGTEFTRVALPVKRFTPEEIKKLEETMKLLKVK